MYTAPSMLERKILTLDWQGFETFSASLSLDLRSSCYSESDITNGKRMLGARVNFPKIVTRKGRLQHSSGFGHLKPSFWKNTSVWFWDLLFHLKTDFYQFWCNRSSEGCGFDPRLGLRCHFLSIELEDRSSTDFYLIALHVFLTDKSENVLNAAGPEIISNGRKKKRRGKALAQTVVMKTKFIQI